MPPVVFDNGDQPFMDWMQKHPTGYVINTTGGKNTAYLLIHRSKCFHIAGYTSRWRDGAFTQNGYIKVCSTSVPELVNWVRVHRQRVLTCKPCGTCKPDVAEIVPVRAAPTPRAEDFEPPERVQMTDYRILRDSSLARWVKQIHSDSCQICGHSILLPSGARYSEAHHIRPLGAPHNGPDHTANILCVCPNHHAELDYLARPLELSELRTHPDHRVSVEYLEYHNQQHDNTKKA